MNIIILPFHDFRKSTNKGFRNRDGHFIQHLCKRTNDIQRILIINRPRSFPERIRDAFFSKKLPGRILKKTNSYKLYDIGNERYVLDIFFYDFFKLILKGKSWYFWIHRQKRFYIILDKVIKQLELSSYAALISNLYNGSFYENISIKPQSIVFDAFDNWLRIPAFSKFKKVIRENYEEYAHGNIIWITNSEENITFYKKKFVLEQVYLLKSGVDVDRFKREKIPIGKFDEISSKPVIGFGGKISHLIDIDLLNYLIDTTPNVNFAFVGEIFDKQVFKLIHKKKNVFFFGDIIYDNYPNYLLKFDIGIIPYHVKDKSHGIDSLKFYEYLAAHIPVVATNGNGLEKISDNVYLCNDKYEFKDAVITTLKEGWIDFEIPYENTWEKKTDQLIEYLKYE